MTGGAAAAVGAEALKEGVLFVDDAGGGVSGDGSGAVTERSEVGNQSEDGCGGAERCEAEKDHQDAAIA